MRPAYSGSIALSGGTVQVVSLEAYDVDGQELPQADASVMSIR